ncbi:MAG: hypothetical protein A2987_03855 [Omnitrophica bacterium RIFCSPLOWO2_01_FULL_45_10]|nr:MAG: hypothetical protein A2987_03855 [Omnitrophica bacterium RIFCSPLOWO2_01_FULL_45_10]
MFKVSLINPPERAMDGSYKYYLPFSLLYLAAYLESNGMSVDIVDEKAESSYFDSVKNRISNYSMSIAKRQPFTGSGLYSSLVDKIIKKAESSSPNLIGISCMTREYNSVMRLANELKGKSGIPIVVGGIHPSLYPEQFIYETSPVDFAVIGEGEETLLELAKYIESGKEDYDSIDGISYLKNGMARRTKVRTIMNDLSISPMNVYQKLNMRFYTRPHAFVTRHVRISGVQIFTSRGCPYNCTFCSGSVIRKMNKFSRPIRYRPVRSVIEEIKFLKDRFAIDGFYIMDDTFCVDRAHAEEFCGELKNMKMNLVWACETRSNLVDEALLKKMKDSGLVQIDVGVESGSDEMLKEIEKGITAADTMKIFSLARKHGVRAFASVMINLPNETVEQLQDTIRLLEKLRPSGGVVGAAIPLPKTELFNKYFVHKLKDDSEITELFGWRLDHYRKSDRRFHLCGYDADFEDIINKLIIKHFLFTELRLGPWYWKVFLRSKRKLEYICSIVQGLVNVMGRIITRYRFKKIRAKIPNGWISKESAAL